MKKLTVILLMLALLASTMSFAAFADANDAATKKEGKNYLFAEFENADYRKEGNINVNSMPGEAYGANSEAIYFEYPADSKWHDLGTADDNPAVKLKFTIPADGQYYIWFRGLHTSANDDSIYYSVDGGKTWERQSFWAKEYDVDWDPECGFYQFYWLKNVKLVGSNPFEFYPVSLKKGEFEIQVKFREVFGGASIYLDKIMITDDADFNPNKVGFDPEFDAEQTTEVTTEAVTTTDAATSDAGTTEASTTEAATTEADTTEAVTDPADTEDGRNKTTIIIAAAAAAVVVIAAVVAVIVAKKKKA